MQLPQHQHHSASVSSFGDVRPALRSWNLDTFRCWRRHARSIPLWTEVSETDAPHTLVGSYLISNIYIFIRHNNVEVFQRSGLPTISDIITSPSHVPGVTLHTWTREGVPPNTWWNSRWRPSAMLDFRKLDYWKIQRKHITSLQEMHFDSHATFTSLYTRWIMDQLQYLDSGRPGTFQPLTCSSTVSDRMTSTGMCGAQTSKNVKRVWRPYLVMTVTLDEPCVSLPSM